MAENTNTACGACVAFGTAHTCGICFSPCRPINLPCSVSFSAPATKPHAFCAPCIVKYVNCKIADGCHDLKCPQLDCQNGIGTKLLQGLKNKGLLTAADLRRLKELQDGPRVERLREIFLSPAPGLYEALCNSTQACPHCYTLTQRDGGCAHMTCGVCSGEYCWYCGEAYPLPSGHQHNAITTFPQLNAQGTCSALELADAARARFQQGASDNLRVGAGERLDDQTFLPRAVESKEEARALLMDRVLTLRCSNRRCQHPVVMQPSFDECFSLRCPRCSSHLCAWCLRLSPEGEDPHSHVLDCPHAPEDMRGSALYLHEGPHVPPHPYRKFSQHWAVRTHATARSFLTSLRNLSASCSGSDGQCEPCSPGNTSFTLSAEEEMELLAEVDARLGSESGS